MEKRHKVGDYLIIRELKDLRERIRNNKLISKEGLILYIDDMLEDFQGRKGRTQDQRRRESLREFHKRGKKVGYDFKNHRWMREKDFPDDSSRQAFIRSAQEMNKRRIDAFSPEFMSRQIITKEGQK